MPEEHEIFTLKQVATSIQKAISERYHRLYWVKAEMHKLNYTNKGHCYPELVHKEDGKLVADMRGQIWKANYDRISKNFAEIVKEPLRDGMTLLFQVKITFHPLYGMSLDIMDIDPTFALGELHKEREETLKRLTMEGVINANKSLNFPLLPKRIAVISVESSKGLSDFYSVIKNNTWGYNYFFMLFTAQLNGDPAIEAIQAQLKKIEKVKEHFDIVTIIRGGGGEIGLSCYNNYELSKAIATFPLPVLTGIGHSTNTTVSEMVAYRNAITPTELADYLLQSFHNFSVPVKEAQRIVVQESKVVLKNANESLTQEIRVFKGGTTNTLQSFKHLLKDHSKNLFLKSNIRFHEEKKELFSENERLKSGTKKIHNEEKYALNHWMDQLKKEQTNFVFQTQNQLEDVRLFFHQSLPKRFEKENEMLHNVERNIRLVDPREVLKRGYSITTLNGKLVSSTNPVSKGDRIEINTFDSVIESEVINVKPTKNE
jgi:exodeoxyribonuclease VII large subunit